MDFHDQTVVITGAAGNLGAAVARAFTECNANVVLVDLEHGALAGRFDVEGDRRLFVAADVTRLDGARVVAASAVARFRTIDVLCNIVGAFRMGDAVHETSDETWNLLFDVNARSVLNMARAVVPGMLERRGGKIVNVAAYAALAGAARMGAYCASKAVVIRLTESLSAELREHGINVNCVLPQTLDTPQNRAAMPDADPAGWVAPEDLAQTIVFLASPAARAIHGACMPVTGSG